ncbi:hypothetical protein EJB05_39375, partial [Eragrostis curvula]
MCGSRSPCAAFIRLSGRSCHERRQPRTRMSTAHAEQLMKNPDAFEAVSPPCVCVGTPLSKKLAACFRYEFISGLPCGSSYS